LNPLKSGVNLTLGFVGDWMLVIPQQKCRNLLFDLGALYSDRYGLDKYLNMVGACIYNIYIVYKYAISNLICI
jgi:hypothetical protein